MKSSVKGIPTFTSHPPEIIHVISVPGPSPYSAALPLACIILNASRREKNGGGLGMRLARHISDVQMYLNIRWMPVGIAQSLDGLFDANSIVLIARGLTV